MPILSVNQNVLNVHWEDNPAVYELIEYARKEPIVVQTTLYGGFEQVGRLPKRFSQNDRQYTTVPGDIMLYCGNQIALYFDENTWSFTKLGHIEGLSQQALTELLGGTSATVEIRVP